MQDVLQKVQVVRCVGCLWVSRDTLYLGERNQDLRLGASSVREEVFNQILHHLEVLVIKFLKAKVSENLQEQLFTTLQVPVHKGDHEVGSWLALIVRLFDEASEHCEQFPGALYVVQLSNLHDHM